MKIPKNNLAYPVLIFVDNKSGGTGFRIHRNNKLFLVTAKHVLFDEHNCLRGMSMELHYPTSDLDDDSIYIYSIDLQNAKPIAHKESDVCVVYLGNIRKPKGEDAPQIKTTLAKGVECLQKGKTPAVIANSEKICKVLNEVNISNDIFIYGYPTSLGLNHNRDFDFTKPLLRKGIVSNIDLKKGVIILDCKTDYGNSGGPVIEVDRNNNHKLIGVVSKFLTYKNEWLNARDKTSHVENINAGYTVAVSIEKVFEIIDAL